MRLLTTTTTTAAAAAVSPPTETVSAQRINEKYNRTVILNECNEAEEAVKDLIMPILPDNISGLSVLALLHLSEDDIDNVCDLNPNLGRALMKDLTKLNRRICRQLVENVKEKIQMDGDAFRLEHILRKTVADLEVRKVKLEVSLSEEQEELERLRNKADLERQENLKLQLRLRKAKEHLIEAGVLETTTEPATQPLPLTLPAAVSCGNGGYSERVISQNQCINAGDDRRKIGGRPGASKLKRPEWKY